MCGLYFSSNISSIDIEGLQKSMTERGGDDFQHHSVMYGNKLLNFAHSRLEINLRGSVNQPFISDNLGILFNGEIYNYRSFTSNDGEELSEIEVIYKLYSEGGIEALRSLDGMFAIVIVDLIKKQIICLRDFVGQKPLWINVGKDSFEIASDPSYFQGEVGATEHYVNYVSKVNLGFGLGLSCITGLSEVSSNSVEVFDLEARKPVSKSTLFKSLLDSKSNSKDVTQNTDFSKLIIDVVKEVVPEQDFGLFLSGGLDSRAVLTGLVKIGCPPTRCFTLKGRETVTAVKVSEYYGIPIEVIDLDSSDNVRIVKSYLSSSNLTSVDPAAIGLVVLSKACRDSGLKVALCGDGGDEALLGYDFFFGNDTKVGGVKAAIINLILRFASLFAKSSIEAKSIENSIVGKHLIRKERIPGLFKLSLSLLSSSQLAKLYEQVCSFSSIQDFYYGFVLPQSLCRKTDTAAHHAKIEVRSPFLQLKFLHAGRSYAEQGLITDNGKKFLREFCKETFEVAPLGRKTGLNLELERSIQVLKDTLNESHINSHTPNKLRFSLVRSIVAVFSLINRKARYASLKMRASSPTT